MWKKAYKGPFTKSEAIHLANGIRVKDENLITGVKIQKRSNKEKYDVFIKTDEKN